MVSLDTGVSLLLPNSLRMADLMGCLFLCGIGMSACWAACTRYGSAAAVLEGMSNSAFSISAAAEAEPGSAEEGNRPGHSEALHAVINTLGFETRKHPASWIPGQLTKSGCHNICGALN